MKCICKFCNNSSSENLAIEIDFRTGIIYYICPHCKKENSIELEKKVFTLPKSTRIK